MPYITHADLLDNPGALELAEVASDEQALPVAADLLTALLRGEDVGADWPAADIDAAQRAVARIDAAVADADAVIDGYLAKRGYALPLAPVHRLVTAWSRVIARHTLHKNRLAGEGKDPITRAYKDALALLAQVAAGKFSLGAGDVVANDTTDARFCYAPNVFGRDQLKAFR